MESPQKKEPANSLLTNYFVKQPSAKKSDEGNPAEPDVFDYGDSVSTTTKDTTKSTAAIGKSYFQKGPEYYRFPMVIECTIVNRELFTQNHQRVVQFVNQNKITNFGQ